MVKNYFFYTNSKNEINSCLIAPESEDEWEIKAKAALLLAAAREQATEEGEKEGDEEKFGKNDENLLDFEWDEEKDGEEAADGKDVDQEGEHLEEVENCLQI
jgi:hypothetical protein